MSENTESIDAAHCPAAIDVAALLARHARAFGSPDEVAAALPLSVSGKLTHGNAVGTVELFVKGGDYRTTMSIGPAHVDEGIEKEGAWHIDLPGVFSRLTGLEAIEMNITMWLLRRTYVTDPGFATRCSESNERAIVYLTLPDRVDLGRPELAFDWGSAALLEEKHFDVLGEETRTTFVEWHDPTPTGLRWPRKKQMVSGVSDVMTYDLERPRPGLGGAGCEGQVCLEPRPVRISMKLGKEDTTVTLPFTFYENEILLEADLAGRKVDALLDSGAGLTVLDATSEAGKAFVSGLEIGGEGTTQRVRAGLGEIAQLNLGELSIAHLPTASVPVPLFVDFGARRPELIVGWTLFEALVVRIDYAREQLVISRSVAPSDTANTNMHWLPLIDSGAAIAEATMEGQKGLVAIDTGNAGTLSLTSRWSREHGLPGGRPVVEQRALSGAGTKETVTRWMRLAQLDIGPLSLANRLVAEDERPSGASAGLLGNDALATCQAIVFDVPHRRLGIEGPCDRVRPSDRAGWRLTRDDAHGAFAKTPWVIHGLMRGGSAEQAGIRDGDRLLAISGKPATIDRVAIRKVTSGNVGTKVRVVVARNGRRKKLIMTLKDLLPMLPSATRN